MAFHNVKKRSAIQTPAEKLSVNKGPARKARAAANGWSLICRCREIRNDLGLTIRDVAAATGISNPCICDVERGAETTISTARKLAKFYGKTIDWLWPELVEAPDRKRGDHDGS